MQYAFSNQTAVIRFATDTLTQQRAIGLYPGTSNTCVVEITLFDSPDDAGAVWHAWPSGEVTTDTYDVFYAVCTAMRARRTAGTSDGNVLIIHPGP